jgi:SRSO17 transposase
MLTAPRWPLVGRDAGYPTVSVTGRSGLWCRVTRDTDGLLPERWLIAQWPDDQAEPVKYWLSSLPATTSHADLVRYGKIRWRIEHDYRELKTGLGLDHFEGRSFTGWHRHVTLVTAAHLFITELRLDPKAAAPA